MYKVIQTHIEGIVPAQNIPELRQVHPCMAQHLRSLGYDVLHERLAFNVPHSNYGIALRVDFLAFKSDEVLIVECKGCPFGSTKIFGSILQLTMYMRLYQMLQKIPNPQLLLSEDWDPLLVRQGTVRGALAIPFVFPNGRRTRLFEQTYNGMREANLLEADIEIWDLRYVSRVMKQLG